MTPTWKQFEGLVFQILSFNSFEVKSHKQRGDAGFDFTGILDGEQWAIEVKYYRSERAKVSLIEAAAARVVNNGIKGRADRGMLVVSNSLPEKTRLFLEDKYKITFIDRDGLFSWCESSPSLTEELESLLGPRSRFFDEENNLSKIDRIRSSLPLEIVPQDTRGTTLCNELKKIKRGNKSWLSYEAYCEEALRYLFPNDLQGWHKQKRTDDGLSRYDLVCRVQSTSAFWKFVCDSLDSRYVLFEFKNYSGKIKQGQIITTEKYLLERGLRRVAVIVSRLGADDNAKKMTRGAMREHGKLMLVLDDDTLCAMLHMKERGEDPSDCLFELADDFLLSLSR